MKRAFPNPQSEIANPQSFGAIAPDGMKIVCQPISPKKERESCTNNS